MTGGASKCTIVRLGVLYTVAFVLSSNYDNISVIFLQWMEIIMAIRKKTGKLMNDVTPRAPTRLEQIKRLHADNDILRETCAALRADTVAINHKFEVEKASSKEWHKRLDVANKRHLHVSEELDNLKEQHGRLTNANESLQRRTTTMALELDEKQALLGATCAQVQQYKAFMALLDRAIK